MENPGARDGGGATAPSGCDFDESETEKFRSDATLTEKKKVVFNLSADISGEKTDERRRVLLPTHTLCVIGYGGSRGGDCVSLCERLRGPEHI